MFLHILAHHTNDRVIKHSGEAISRYFSLVLNSMFRLQEVLPRAPNSVLEDCNDDRCKWFKVIDIIDFKIFVFTTKMGIVIGLYQFFFFWVCF